MYSTSLASINRLQWQIVQLSATLAAKGDRGADSVGSKALDEGGGKQPTPELFMSIVELEDRIKAVYKPQIATMEQQITALTKLIEYLQNQLQTQNT